MHTVVATVFPDEAHAKEAFRRLQDVGVSGDDIGLVMREEVSQEQRDQKLNIEAHKWAGASAGAVAGAAAGAAIAIPMVGPVLALGALAAAILSAAGGTVGWLAGGLVAHGFRHDEARFYQQAVEEGSVLMTVKTDEQNMERVRSVLRICDGREYRAA
ncbi:MAG TPA: hypothetical protein VF157_13085 [Chloroflexota bacterium]